MVLGLFATSVACVALLLGSRHAVCRQQQQSHMLHDGSSPGNKYSFRPGSPELQVGNSHVVDMNWAISFARLVISRLTRFEKTLTSSDVTVRQGTPAQGQLIESNPNPDAMKQGSNALMAVKASIFLAHNQCRRYGHAEDFCARFVSKMKMNKSSLGEMCSAPLGQKVSCGQRQYRSVNGSCNHLDVPSSGQALTGYLRLVPAHYGDGLQESRHQDLPSARLVTSALTTDGNELEEETTLALMQWSQFIEHDMSHTPVSRMTNTGSPIMCCRSDGLPLMPRYIHPSCMPIIIPEDDPFYSPFRIKCMNYVRSMPAMRSDCTFGPKEQMNQATHYLDGSMIYGSTEQDALSLRLLSGGLLREDPAGPKGFLPSANQPTRQCQVQSDHDPCYHSGDARVNSHPQLTVMHVLWHREHNRLAKQLAMVNPMWSDEILYQEARRIVIAEIQHITYNDWLPLVLGPSYMESLGLNISSGMTREFDEMVNPAVSNCFATAAMRYVHSMIASRLRLYDKQRGEENRTLLNLGEHFNRPRVVKEFGHLDALIRGLATQPSHKNDMDYVQDMTNLLYRGSEPHGLDVVSLDIQRGRDHGLPGYNHFREKCGLTTARTFAQLTDNIPQHIVDKLETVYAHPDDVDLLIGGMSERRGNEGVLGHTFRCILGEQFSRSARGDRFFYDLEGQPHSFTKEQLTSIKKTSLARIFCDNGDSIEKMQPNIFKIPSHKNTLTSCLDQSRIPSFDLTAWK